MKNVLKISFLGIIGIFLLTYLTADKPKEVATNANGTLTYVSLPAQFEIVGQDAKVAKANLIKKGEKTLIVVGNHDSLAIVKDLPKYYEVTIPYVMVANISAAPWFVKKMFIPGKLEELNQGSKIPMIYDFEGDMVNALAVTDNAKTKFSAYLVEANGAVKNIFKGEVKEGALDGSMNEEEIKAVLLPLSKLIQ